MFSQGDIKYILNADFYDSVRDPLNALCKSTKAASPEEHKEGKAHFPKQCSKCGKMYYSPKDFIDNTTVLNDDNDMDVCYEIAGKAKIFRYRNCPSPCNSTLVAVTDERRDTSKLGLERREIFGQIQQELETKLGEVDRSAIHDLTLYLFRCICYEGIGALEAYVMLRKDIESGSFLGFEAQQPVLVEKLNTPKKTNKVS